MANTFTPNSSVAGLDGVDGVNKDKIVQVGAIQVGDQLLTSSEVAIINDNGDAGAVGAATVVATEKAVGDAHVTELTLTAFSVGTIGDAASKGIGAKIYTLPAGAIVVEDASIVGGLTADADVVTDTPEVGIGTVVASGVIATLSTTAEDIVDGGAAGYVGGDAIAPDVNGTVFYKGRTFTTPVMIKTSGGKSHDLFLNVADGWANVDLVGPPVYTGVLTFTGTITLRWRKVS
jgi:hypothetical protein